MTATFIVGGIIVVFCVFNTLAMIILTRSNELILKELRKRKDK